MRRLGKVPSALLHCLVRISVKHYNLHVSHPAPQKPALPLPPIGPLIAEADVAFADTHSLPLGNPWVALCYRNECRMEASELVGACPSPTLSLSSTLFTQTSTLQ